MRVVFIGTVEFSKSALEKLIDLKADIAGVLTKSRSSFNSDFVDLSEVSRRNNIPCRYVNDINNQKDMEWIEKLQPDIIFCLGFSHILSRKILSIAPIGIVGYHPARLPQNRGRHPITWALVLGLEKTASTFFFMDEGVDSGDILNQAEVKIGYKDDARSLYDKITKVALRQLGEFFPKLGNKKFKRIAQDHSKADYWRKRGKNDGKIDFRMNSRAIYNLVRGLTRPYTGAHLIYKNREIKIWEAEEKKLKSDGIKYGKVLDIKNNHVLIKCSDNAVVFTKHEFKKLPKVGEYL